MIDELLKESTERLNTQEAYRATSDLLQALPEKDYSDDNKSPYLMTNNVYADLFNNDSKRGNAKQTLPSLDKFSPTSTSCHKGNMYARKEISPVIPFAGRIQQPMTIRGEGFVKNP